MNNLCVVDTVTGYAFGGEFSLRRNLTKRLAGWLSYTLSRSMRDASLPGTLGSGGQTRSILSAFDRTHVVSALASYDLGAHWRAGLRVVAYTGLPYTDTRFYVPIAPYNGERMPAFYRIDVRVEKRWNLGARGTIAFVLEGMNVTFHKEVLGVHCAPTANEGPQGVDTCTPQTLGPVAVPSVGVEGSL
jgi:hypothetical protein